MTILLGIFLVLLGIGTILDVPVFTWLWGVFLIYCGILLIKTSVSKHDAKMRWDSEFK